MKYMLKVRAGAEVVPVATLSRACSLKGDCELLRALEQKHVLGKRWFIKISRSKRLGSLWRLNRILELNVSMTWNCPIGNDVDSNIRDGSCIAACHHLFRGGGS